MGLLLLPCSRARVLGVYRTASCSPAVGCATGVAVVVLRWSRHRETPRAIRATPSGTAIGRLNDSGRTASEAVATVLTARSAAAQRGKTRARNRAIPKIRPPRI